MKKYLIIIPMLLVIYILTLNDNSILKEDKSDVKESKENVEINQVSLAFNDKIINLDIDDYVIGVLACEMPASFSLEALKAGAVAARTFYIYKETNDENYVASTSDQCYIDENGMKDKWKDSFDKYSNIIKNAVKSTEKKYITYNGQPVQSFYFSMSNGYTENVQNVFKEERPYLVSTPSLWEKDLDKNENIISMKKQEFLKKLNLDIEENIVINIISRNTSNRVDLLEVNGVEFLGTNFRKLLSLKSTDFDIDIEGDDVKIVTRGYGHGVGMSQYGANEMAKLGYNYEDILKYYYKDVEISSL